MHYSQIKPGTTFWDTRYIYRVTTNLENMENLENSGNFKNRGKLGEILISTEKPEKPHENVKYVT